MYLLKGLCLGVNKSVNNQSYPQNWKVRWKSRTGSHWWIPFFHLHAFPAALCEPPPPARTCSGQGVAVGDAVDGLGTHWASSGWTCWWQNRRLLSDAGFSHGRLDIPGHISVLSETPCGAFRHIPVLWFLDISSTSFPSPAFDNQNSPQMLLSELFGVKVPRLHLSDKYNDKNRSYWIVELGHLRLQDQVVRVSQETDGTIDLEQL